ncbi:hypothetical protein GOP47_0028986 [Adiantum capillus-veneris]|nr:hypothetical protein GOP47_0028986 [Adiantum capillus-veneris]
MENAKLQVHSMDHGSRWDAAQAEQKDLGGAKENSIAPIAKAEKSVYVMAGKKRPRKKLVGEKKLAQPRKVIKHMHLEIGISSNDMAIMGSFSVNIEVCTRSNDYLHGLYSKNPNITNCEIEIIMQLTLHGELAKHAFIYEDAKDVTKFTSA